jgi:L-asparaginase II
MKQSFQSNKPPQSASLVEVRRGDIVESRHRGFIIVMDGDERIKEAVGSPEAVTYLRSASKPHQAIPLVTTGAADAFGFTEKEIAIASGSHNGDPEHTETVASMLGKIGLDSSFLRCGTHTPYSPEAARALSESGRKPDVLQNNCSGKHAGMLAVAKHIGAPVETYDRPDHPVQKLIAETISQFSGVGISDTAVGIDGCGVPVFGMPLVEMARMYARLIKPPQSFDAKLRAACERIVHAMVEYPVMIGGETESQDTALMKATSGRVIAKAGAEGLFTGAVLPGAELPSGLAVVVKIEDGDPGKRARRPVVTEVFRQLGVLSESQLGQLSHYANQPIKNNRGDVVGQVAAAFTLETGGRHHETSSG